MFNSSAAHCNFARPIKHLGRGVVRGILRVYFPSQVRYCPQSPKMRVEKISDQDFVKTNPLK